MSQTVSLALSKQHLQSELVLSRTPHRARNRACRRRADRAVRKPEIRMVEKVERLHAELHPHSLRDRKALEQREVPLGQPRAGKNIAPRVAERETDRRNA